MPFRAVLNRNPEIKLLRDPDCRHNIVTAVGMRLQGDLPLQNRDQRFHLHVKLGQFGNVIPCSILPGHIVSGVEEHFPEFGRRGHPR